MATFTTTMTDDFADTLRGQAVEKIISNITKERRAEGDSAAEVGAHLQGAVTDLFIDATDSLNDRDITEQVLGLIDWPKVAQSAIDTAEGTGWAQFRKEK